MFIFKLAKTDSDRIFTGICNSLPFEFNEDFDPDSEYFVRDLKMKDSAGDNGGHCKDCGVDERAVLITKFRKTQMFADIMDATQLSVHAKIPEKITSRKKQNKDLGGATDNDVKDELVGCSLKSICRHRKTSAVVVLCLKFKNLKSILSYQPDVYKEAKWFSVSRM